MIIRNIKWVIFPIIVVIVLFAASQLTKAADPSSSFTIYSEIRDIEGVKISIDLAWTLLCGFLVFNMQAGFAFWVPASCKRRIH